MRRTLALVSFLLLAGFASAAEVTFVSPLEGSQAIGPMLLEVTTSVEKVDRVEFYVDGVLAAVARTAPWRVYFDFGTDLRSRVVTAKVLSGGFSKSTTAAVRTAGVTANETLHVDLVELPIRVKSQRTLRAGDLRIRENGVVQQVREVRAERPPAHFAFVVDRSLSMNEGKLEAALDAVGQALKQLRSGDTASLVLFNHNVAPPVRISVGDDLRARFASTPTSGGTSLRDAVASVASADRTYTIVLTDGGDRNSSLDDETALRRISGTKTILNAIVLGRTHALFLDRAAQNTGGTVLSAGTSDVARTLGSLLADINSRYLVVYQSHGTKRGWRKVEVGTRTGVAISSVRRGYFAAP